MKRISLWILLATFSVATVFGQDAGTQQQIDKLTGQVQDLLDAQAQQGKRLDALAKDIAELRDKLSTPTVNNSASADDLKTLAAQVQEIDKKRQADRDLIIKQIEQLGKVATGAPVKPKIKTTPTPDDTTAPAPATPQKGYEYTVKAGDTLSLIAKAYREQGVKVTTAQLLKANPGLDATKLYVGKKVFIPDANAK